MCQRETTNLLAFPEFLLPQNHLTHNFFNSLPSEILSFLLTQSFPDRADTETKSSSPKAEKKHTSFFEWVMERRKIIFKNKYKMFKKWK